MIALGIDPATTTGYCVLGNDYSIVSVGHWDYKRLRKSGRGAIYKAFEDDFTRALVVFDVGLVAIENQVTRYRNASRLLMGLLAVSELAAHRLGKKIVTFESKEVKKFATGNGNASKDMMVAAANFRGNIGRGEEIDFTHDEADAYFLARLGAERAIDG